MTYLGCAATEEDGANFIPATMGEFMKEPNRLLREARAGAAVVKEARLFHERQARKHGLSSRRGSAHLRAARMFSREAGASLQERLESFNHEIGELPPNVLAKATKDTINFHQKMAKKHGLDTDLGHAHTAAMEHHMDTLNKLKQSAGNQPKQKPQQVSGPEVGDGPMDSGGPGVATHGSKKEALPGASGKMSPVPVPKKSQMPNNDIKQNKPPIDLDAQQGGGRRLQQGEEGGPGSGPRKGYGSPDREQYNKYKSQLQDRIKTLKSVLKSTPKDTEKFYKVFNRIEDLRDELKSHMSEHPSHRSSESNRSFESRMRKFSRETDGRGPNDGTKCTLPETDPLKQLKKDKIYRDPQNVKRESRRYLRRG